MDFEIELLKEHTYENSERIAWYAMDHPETFPDLLKLFSGKDSRITQRATLAIIICTEWKPKMVKPYIEQMILNLKNKDISGAVKRNTTRILAEFPIPKHMEGILTEVCFEYLNNMSEAVAIRIFSMIILERIVEKYPELKSELILSIERGMEFGSAGFRNRGGKILAKFKIKKI